MSTHEHIQKLISPKYKFGDIYKKGDLFIADIVNFKEPTHMYYNGADIYLYGNYNELKDLKSLLDTEYKVYIYDVVEARFMEDWNHES